MGCLRRQTNLTPGAVALVDETCAAQSIDGIQVQRESLRLANHLTVPIQPDAGERAQLLGLVQWGRCHPIEVFHPHQELSITLSRDQPRDQRCSEVSEVQLTRRRGGESAARRVDFSRTM